MKKLTKAMVMAGLAALAMCAGSQSVHADDSVFSALYNREVTMDSRVKGAGASAAALAALDFDQVQPGQKWQIAGGVGNYRNETAAALGVKYHVNDDLSFHMGATAGADENMVNGGFSLALGHGEGAGKDVLSRLDALEEENKKLNDQLQMIMKVMSASSILNTTKTRSFKDVPENHWANHAVAVLYGNDVLNGYEDGLFHGDRYMTRYEVAEMMYDALSRGMRVDPNLLSLYGLNKGE
jgi:hypothetical protein